jgi:hypothetical protein
MDAMNPKAQLVIIKENSDALKKTHDFQTVTKKIVKNGPLTNPLLSSNFTVKK